MLEMKVDEIHSVLGEDEDAEAMRVEIKRLQARLAFSEDARTSATYDVTKAQTIQKACVIAQKKAESQLKSCQSMIQAKDKELTEVLNELTKAKGLLAKLGVPGYTETWELWTVTGRSIEELEGQKVDKLEVISVNIASERVRERMSQFLVHLSGMQNEALLHCYTST
ncbi:hypothetical protein Fot_04527 [Forsythia ovata]|uniref:Uncharacterized protein n=1 Tax=Forsythia ovata TaxID=205694 RepID=A0ABD1XFV5_9LAMI